MTSLDDQETIYKEALLPAQHSPFAGRRGRLPGMLASIGRKGLARKSESYGQALAAMEEMDRNLRERFKLQKNAVKQAYWGKFKMDIKRFALAADQFMKHQLVIVAFTTDKSTKEGMKQLLANIPLEIYRGSGSAGTYGPPSEIHVDIADLSDRVDDRSNSGERTWVSYAEDLYKKQHPKQQKKQQKKDEKTALPPVSGTELPAKSKPIQ